MGESLTVLSLNADSFQGCASLEDEWKVVKKAFLKIALVSHPDKGGDAVAFQRARQAFDGLRTLYEAGLIARFVGDFEGVQFPSQETEPEREGPPPPWEFYEAAAEDVMPIYRVELAKSSRSACQKCKKTIDEGTIRAGWMDPITGSYGRWCHIGCWKVPSKIWLGLPVGLANDVASVVAALSQMGGVLLSGFAQLDNDEKRLEVAMHVMQKDNWAALKKAKKGKTDKNDAVSERSIVPAPAALAPGTDVGPANRRVFVTPLPGKDAAVAGALSGWTCVLTGTFPEIGGGSGLDLGKDRVTQMIAGFGGRVTQAISGRTNLLVVGKSPGFSKFDKATRLGVKKVSLADLAETLRKGEPIANVPAFVSEMRTRDFSTGFYNNGLAGESSFSGYLSLKSNHLTTLQGKCWQQVRRMPHSVNAPKRPRLELQLQ